MLCGGRSQRMGRPKALLPWFGRSMIEHVVAVLAPCVDEVVVVTSGELGRLVFTTPVQALAAGVRVAVRQVVDREPDRGPLAALRDGLAATRAELAFVTSTDAPFLVATYVDALLRAAAAYDRDGAPRAIVPRADGFLQVLSAVYPREAGREAEALLAAGIASPVALALQIGACVLEVASSNEAAPWTGFNTPGEYLALARRLDPGTTARVEWRIEGAGASDERADASTVR